MSVLQTAAFCGGERLPFAPLEQIAGKGCGLQTARALGIHPRMVYRWRHNGLTWAQADELAVRLGLHPATVWGRAWWAAADDV